MEAYNIRLERDGGIHPGDIPAWKLATLISVLSSVLAEKSDDLRLTGIEDNCVRLDFACSSPSVIANVGKTLGIIAALAVGTTTVVPPEKAESIAELDRVRERLFPNVAMHLPKCDKVQETVISPGTRLAANIERPAEISYATTLYGKLMDAGGEKPNLHIRPVGSDSEVICDCSEEIAAEAAKLLYTMIGVEGTVEHGGFDRIKRMRVSSILPYRQKPGNPLEELRKLGYDKHFRKLGMTVPEYMDWVRGSDAEVEDAKI